MTGARGRMFAWLRSHPSEAEALEDVPPDVLSTVWDAAWRGGAWDALQQNTTLGLNLSQIVERLEALAQLYGDVYVERQADRELSESSAYWKSEVEA